MTSPGFSRALVLGGIRSGKSEFAESLAAPADRVRYVATARRDGPDLDWVDRIDRHRARRPPEWVTVELGHAPGALADLLAAADPAETLLVEDLGTWVATLVETASEQELVRQANRLASAVRSSRSRIVLVTAEVGLSVVPATRSGRVFADALGGTNRALADVCDVVVLVIAGNAMWLKGGP